MKQRFIVKAIVLQWFALLFAISALCASTEDSLEIVLKTRSLTNPQKLKIYDDLSWQYLSYDFEKARLNAQLGIRLARESKSTLMEGTLWRNLGVAYYMVSKYDSATACYDNAMQIADKTKDALLKAQVFAARGNLFNVTGDYPKALEFYLKALPVFEKLGRKDRVRIILGNIGALNSAMHNHKEAEKYFIRSLALSNEIDDDAGRTQAYDGLSRVAIEGHDYKKALYYSQKAVELCRKTGNKKEESIALQGLAWIYYEHFKDYKKAEEFALQGLEIAEELQFPGDIAAMLNTLSNVYFHQGRYVECEAKALKAIDTDTSDMNIFSNLAANVVRAGIHNGDKVRALYYFDKYRQIFNIQSNKDFQEAMQEMQVKYETAKKEKEITILSSQKRERNILIYSLLGILVVSTGLGYSIYHNTKNKRTIAEQQLLVKEKQLAEMEKERQLLATQSVLKGEEAERSRMARDLHDGLGGLLSGVKINLSAMKGNAIFTNENIKAFDNALKLLDTSISELRRVAHNLMPETLNHYGLKTAVMDYVNEMKTSVDTDITFSFFGDEVRYSPQLELTVYRIVQELVNNALKHAEAQKIGIVLIAKEERLCVQVVDNGKGFRPDQIKGDGKGLVGIRDRVTTYKGQFEIESEPGKGTDVSIEFSLL
jgi:signal transduction histidine kinase